MEEEKRSVVMDIPKKVGIVIGRLRDAGYEAFAVGGCVRDSLLGREPQDWDITTSAKPAQVKEVFAATVDTGLQHGTVTVIVGHEGFEVTTYRVDGAYSDGRHPDSVVFTSNLREDLARRDFTINAMAYSPETGLVDAFGGIRDLEDRVIRCVGDPNERFDEDALRILRAVRFAGQLDFAIEPATAAALAGFAEKLRLVSVERIEKELEKLIVSDGSGHLRDAQEAGILRVVIPSFDALFAVPSARIPTVSEGEFSVSVMERAKTEDTKHLAALRLAALFAPLGEGSAEKLLKGLKFDGDTTRTASALVGLSGLAPEKDAEEMRRLVNRAGKDLCPLLFSLRRAKLLAERDKTEGELGDYEERESLLTKAEDLFAGVMERGEATDLSGLAVKGGDLIAAGIPAGRQMGQILHGLLEIVLKDPSRNEKNFLLGEAARLAAKM